MADRTDGETDVLIVGAGPTGLALAIELRRRGVDCRLVERNDSSVETSRALAIQPRTLQAFEDMGVLDDVLDEGMRVTGATVYRGRTELFRLDTDNLAESPYPFLWWLPQNRTERILVERLEALGGEVEFERELTGFGQADGTVTATVEHADTADGRSETITADWLVGCDGAHSRVRETLGLELRGVTTDQEILVADVDVDWDRPRDEGAIWFHEDGVLAALPMLGETRWRLFADVTPTPPARRPEASRDVLERIVRDRTGDRTVSITDAPWTSNFVTNQRTVDRYRSGRVFLAGDAAHVHNPLGGQGMNLGIQDAYNLAWKLSLVLEGTAPEGLLDTYGEERLPVADAVVTETGISGSLLVTANPAVQRVRDTVLPRILDSGRVQARLFRTMAQLDIDYRGRSLSRVHAESPLAGLLDDPSPSTAVRRARRAWHAPKAGDRAPDGPCRRPDGRETSLYREIHGPTAFALLLFAGTGEAGGDDPVHVARTVGEHAGELVRPYLVVPGGAPIPEVDGVTVLIDHENRLHGRYGAATPSMYLLRPDDYVGFRGRPVRVDPLLDYLDERYYLDERFDPGDSAVETGRRHRLPVSG